MFPAINILRSVISGAIEHKKNSIISCYQHETEKALHLLLLFPTLVSIIDLNLNIIMSHYRYMMARVFQGTSDGKSQCFSQMFE